MDFKHDFQQLRYATVKQALMDELVWTHRRSEQALRDGELPPWTHAVGQQKRWLAKDVVDFIAKVKQGDSVLLGKGAADGRQLANQA